VTRPAARTAGRVHTVLRVPLAFVDFLNSREDAAVIWLAAIIAFVVYKSDGGILTSFWDLARTLFPKLAILCGSAAAYCAAVVFLAAKAGLWHTTALKETVYWVFAGCFMLVGRAVHERQGGWRYLRKLLGSAIRITIVVEFVVNLYVFPLLVELILFPVLLTLLVTQDADKYDPSKRDAARFANTAIAYLGVLALTYVGVSAATDLDGLLARENAESLLVAPALAVAVVPFLYAVSWWSQREQRKLDEDRVRRFKETWPDKPLADDERAA
jgi:hypothetical protein